MAERASNAKTKVRTCAGSGEPPTDTWTTDRIMLRFGRCPCCAGSFRVTDDGVLIGHHPQTG
ncbi:MAG: hypothetical protein AB7N61_22450 [Acidimicrobiia bacterium]